MEPRKKTHNLGSITLKNIDELIQRGILVPGRVPSKEIREAFKKAREELERPMSPDVIGFPSPRMATAISGPERRLVYGREEAH